MRRLLFFLLFSLSFLSAAARHIVGRVVDGKTHEDLAGAVVELLNPRDSSVIKSTTTTERQVFGWKVFVYQFDVDNDSTYLLRCSSLGYQTAYRCVTVRMANRVNEQQIDDIALQPDVHTLSEVVVKATKIRMVMRGDTLVYDASALNLSEGSMLDALIRQMPGTTLDNGVIKVNGRTVSSLLIDGRDFFKGDMKKALENLPAFTVDKVKAYDKQGQESRLMGRDMGDKSYVLDVTLKREYKHGLLANADVAGGTNNRYAARLFSMYYTPKERLTLTGSANNVGDTSVPGESGSISSVPDAGGGLASVRNLGAEYRRDGKTEDAYFDTSLSYASDDNETRTRTTEQTFLTGGDIYQIDRNTTRNVSRQWSADASFGLTPIHQMLGGTFSGAYSRNHGNGNGRSGLFGSKPDGDAILDSLFMLDASARLLKHAINRVKNDNQFHGNSYNASLSLYDRVRLGSSGNDELSFNGNFDYGKTTNDRFAMNRIDYLGTENRQDHRYQYSQTPDHHLNMEGSALYACQLVNDTVGLNSLYLRPSYTIRQSYDNTRYNLYRIDQVEGYREQDYTLGMLPSERHALLAAIDNSNSYRSSIHTTQQTAEASLYFTHGDGTAKPQITLSARLPLEWKRERLTYFRNKDYEKERHNTFFNPMVDFRYQFNDSTGTRFVECSYSTSQSVPELSTLLDIRDDANPLDVMLGNPNLKKARSHNVSLSASLFRLATQRMMNFMLGFRSTHNALASAVVYDKQTGVTTTQQTNVNGNWSASAGMSFSTPLDKATRWRMQNDLSANFNNSVDLTTVEGSDNSRSTVRSWELNNQLELDYQLDTRLHAFAECRVAYHNANSRRCDFQTVNAWDCNLRLGANITMPWGIDLSSDITDYRRMGYNDEQMNRSELVWNARLSKKLVHDRLTFMLDAYDILGNLNSTTLVLNEQGRTETWTNSIPRYLMLHVVYRLTLGMAASKKDNVLDGGEL